MKIVVLVKHVPDAQFDRHLLQHPAHPGADLERVELPSLQPGRGALAATCAPK